MSWNCEKLETRNPSSPPFQNLHPNRRGLKLRLETKLYYFFPPSLFSLKNAFCFLQDAFGVRLVIPGWEKTCFFLYYLLFFLNKTKTKKTCFVSSTKKHVFFQTQLWLAIIRRMMVRCAACLRACWDPAGLFWIFKWWFCLNCLRPLSIPPMWT